MKLRFLDQPQLQKDMNPSPDCYACNNGCCGSFSNKNQDDLDLLDEIIAEDVTHSM